MMSAVRCSDPIKLHDDFLYLLDKELDGQVYQAYIEDNPYLLPREFVRNHGINFDLVVRKLHFDSGFYM
jgi:hypothetical protein